MHRLLKILSCSLISLVTVLGLVLGSGSPAQASPTRTAGTPASQQARAKAMAIAALKHMKIGGRGHHHKRGRNPYPHSGTETDTTSPNMAGYADTGTNFNQVSATWVVPNVNCLDDSLAAFWVGIDGFPSPTTEQAGVLVDCAAGTPFYFTWWEMAPTSDVQIVGQTVQPGDTISASVTRSGTDYTLAVTDDLNPDSSFSTTQSCTDCANTSAEWIAQAPNGFDGQQPLADFDPWEVDGASVATDSASGAISDFPDQQITMANADGTTLAAPSELTGGNSFTVTWQNEF